MATNDITTIQYWEEMGDHECEALNPAEAQYWEEMDGHDPDEWEALNPEEAQWDEMEEEWEIKSVPDKEWEEPTEFRRRCFTI